MKITVERTIAPQIQHQQSDLPQNPTFPKKPPRRKPGVRLKRDPGAPSSKRVSRPETPLLRWKFDEDANNNSVQEEDKSSVECGRKNRRKVRAVVSARKLGATLWRLHLPECHGGKRVLGPLQSRDGHVGAPIHGHHVDKLHNPPTKDLVHSPHSVSGARNGILYKFEPSFQLSHSAMEGATKWDPVGWKTFVEPKQIFCQPKRLDRQPISAPVISALETELEQARAKINELESERRSSKKKIEQFLRKLSEERAAWRSREHEKIRAIIDDMKDDLNREKKNRQRLEIVHSKLVKELADARLSAKRYGQEYGKERKARELIEEVCDELAKEIGEDKAEVEALKRESMKLQEEVEEERKMLQMAEVWREERVQMKLVDAKVMLEEKYSQMNQLIREIDSFLNSNKTSSDSEETRKAEFLRQVAASVNMQDIRELTYEAPDPDDIFSVFEDVNFLSNEREAEPCVEYSPNSHVSKIHTVSPEVKMANKNYGNRRSDVYIDESGELEEDASEWETVSHPDDQGSSFSPDGSDRDPSSNKIFRVSNVSRTGTEWERSGGDETPIMEISEVGSVQKRQLKKVSSISRLWKSSNGDKIISVEGMNARLSDGRLSIGTAMSADHGSPKIGLSPQDLAGHWMSPDSGNPHMNRVMKGCIEWPRSVQKSSLKSRLLEARMDSQKIQLRQVLKQKI